MILGQAIHPFLTLKRFKGKIDTLKIDRSFIIDLSRTDAEDSNFITKTIIELAQHLEMDVVAEGVETAEQLEILKEYRLQQDSRVFIFQTSPSR